jgi:serine acetyltransferase/GT2 family glycosyltransferase
MSTPDISVVIASYGRAERLRRLLDDLEVQTFERTRFEVVVVDDGAPVPLTSGLASPGVAPAASYALTLLRQDNAGPAAARNRGARSARGTLLVFLDDDMRVAPSFLASHWAAQTPSRDREGPRVVLGALRSPTDRRLPLVERYRIFQLARTAQRAEAGSTALAGTDVYSGNFSMPRALFARLGGFDVALRQSEDAELGVRCVAAGATIVSDAAAWAAHDTDAPPLTQWVARSVQYGAADLSVAARHEAQPDTHPWRFVSLVHPVSRPLLLTSAFAPRVGRTLGWVVLCAAWLAGAARLEAIAMRLVTLSYGLLYFSGLEAGAGNAADLRRSLRRYLVQMDAADLPPGGRVAKCVADLMADHDALHAIDARYRASTARRGLMSDAIQRIGFQIMVAYRVMRLFRALGWGLLARAMSRIMRHLYGSDVHWDAVLAPGVVIVHGMGLCISHGARVGPQCILFQHVTLGESIHPETREIGSPTLEADVHVAPGAVLLGPIVVGRGSKLAANVVLSASVPPSSIVEGASTQVRRREPGLALRRREA